jgi:hypothetical protein
MKQTFTMKQSYTIIWVEDNPDAMTSQIEEIKEYLQKRNFEPIVILDENGEVLKEYLKKKQPIEIIVTDQNLTDQIDGLSILKLLRKKKSLTDVLFYTTKQGITSDDVYNLHYGFVEFVKGKSAIVGPLKRLIDKSLKRYEDIIFLRGMVISMIIDLELKVNEFFVNYFKIPKESQEHFHNFILENQYNSLGGKVITLENIMEGKGLKKEFQKLVQNIRELANNRNLLAHCKTDPKNKNVLICMGKQKKFDKNKINEIIEKVNEVSEHLDEFIAEFPPKKS